MPARASRSAPLIAAFLATLVAAACGSSSSGGGRTSDDGGEGDASEEASDASGSSSGGGHDATGSGSSSGGPPADLDAPQFGPDGCALLNTPCTMGSQCCSGLCPIPQLVCTPPTSQP